jgi:hypothetical protein
MRELGGLSFEEIGETFETSKAVARQTVYEARLGLRELEAGREMGCEEVMHRLSNADGRVSRRRDIRAHLRNCPDCRAFRDGIERRREDLAALSPLPVAAAAATLHAVLGGSQASAGVGAAGAVGAGAGKAVATSAVLKSAATVAAVAAIGAGVADRSGLVDLGLPGDGGSAKPARATERGAAAAQRRAQARANGEHDAGSQGGKPGSSQKGAEAKAPHTGAAAATGPSSHAAPASSGQLPAAAQHGQETAASHGGGRAGAGSHSQGSSHAAEAPKGPPASPPSSPKPEQPSKPQPAPKDIGPDNAPAPPSQSSGGPPNRGGPS